MHYNQPESSVRPFSYFLPLGNTPFLTPIEPTRYDEKGRQIQYKESELQRRERLAFLQRRQWVNRVTMWVNDSANTPPIHDTRVQNMSLDLADYYDEPNAEPYVLYSSPPPSPQAAVVPPAVRRTPSHRRPASLSAIRELPEED
jgi:hypothetical protein